MTMAAWYCRRGISSLGGDWDQYRFNSFGVSNVLFSNSTDTFILQQLASVLLRIITILTFLDACCTRPKFLLFPLSQAAQPIDLVL